MSSPVVPSSSPLQSSVELGVDAEDVDDKDAGEDADDDRRSTGEGEDDGESEETEGGCTALDDGTVEFDPSPVIPPVAPVAVILLSASSCVSQLMLVPAFFTSGSAKHERPPVQGVVAHLPLTHWANPPWTQA